MNKEYTIVGSKAVVSNEGGAQRVIHNCDNIDEILKKENIIEHLEESKRNLLIEISQDSTNKNNSNITLVVMLLISTLIGLIATLNLTSITALVAFGAFSGTSIIAFLEGLIYKNSLKKEKWH